MNYRQKMMILVFSTAILSACTAVDPYTGQTYVDQARTTALIGGLALAGAAAYAANKDDDDDDRDRHHYYDDDDDYYHTPHQYWRSKKRNVFYPAKNIVCYRDKRACYKKNGRYTRKWSKRVFAKRYR